MAARQPCNAAASTRQAPRPMQLSGAAGEHGGEGMSRLAYDAHMIKHASYDSLECAGNQPSL